MAEHRGWVVQKESANAELLEVLLDHSPSAIAVFDREMCYLACSDRWINDFKIGARGSIVGRSHFEVFPEIDEGWRQVQARAQAGEVISCDLDRFRRLDGSLDWVRWKVSPWHEKDGSIGGTVIATEVLTHQIESARLADQSRRELDLLIDSATEHAVCLLDDRGRVVIWNAGAERLFGWSAREVVGKSHSMFFEPADQAAGLPQLQLNEVRQKGRFQGRTWRRRKDGTRFLADVIFSRILGEAGGIVGFGAVVHDISEEGAHARAMDASEEQIRSILATVPSAMVVIDERGVIQLFSAAAERLFGYAAQNVLGQNVSILMPDPDASQHDSYIEHYKQTGERRIIGSNRRVIGRHKNGTTFPVEISIGEAFGGGKRIFTGFMRDLSAREEAEAQLSELQSELSSISRISAVGTMATALAHEINQPLTAVVNYLQTSSKMLRQYNVPNILREAIDQAGEQALRAGSVVNRLREFVSHGELSMSNEAPAALVEQACSLAGVVRKYPGITFKIMIDERLAPALVDRIQIQQVLINLVRNACEAIGGNGTITIDVREVGGATQFTVADDGPGIAHTKSTELFRPFTSTKVNGMGLGLSICRTVVEAHGGRIWYEPAPQGGAAFHFILPFIGQENDNG